MDIKGLLINAVGLVGAIIGGVVGHDMNGLVGAVIGVVMGYFGAIIGTSMLVAFASGAFAMLSFLFVLYIIMLVAKQYGG